MSTRLVVMSSASSKQTIEASVAKLREAQRRWAAMPLRKRLKRIGEFRKGLCARAEGLARLCAEGRSDAEVLVTEILPLCDAARFLERAAAEILNSNRMSRRLRPIWLSGVDGEVSREPFGVVLVIGASNYPVFLVGVQMLQALAAGNAILIKPAPGTKHVIEQLVEIARESGMGGEVEVTDESRESALLAIEAEVNKVFFTGGSEAGNSVMHAAAEKAIPTVMELSGCDAFIVMASADLSEAAAAVRFGLALNNGRTCMRPARLLVEATVASEFNRWLELEIRSAQREATVEERKSLWPLVDNVRAAAGAVMGDELLRTVPLIARLAKDREVELWNSGAMLPIACEVIYGSREECVRLVHSSRYGLSASIFGEERDARELASALNVGTVVINDVIVPTADPRASFTGRGASGFGSTRGAEGLVEMTRPKTVMTRRGKRRHLEPARESDREMFVGALRAMHGDTASTKLRGVWMALRAAMRRSDS